MGQYIIGRSLKKVIISPGYPWQLVPYAWLVEQFGNTVRVGRVVNLLTYYVAGAGLFLATRKLYDSKTATVTTLAFLMSAMFIPEWDYAPKHLLTVVGTWTLYAVASLRTLSVTHQRIAWSAFIGLVVTASLNVHAAGVVFAGAWSLWYMGRFIKGRNRDTFFDALGFGIGALSGVIIYWVANVNPVGGLNAYLDHLRYYRVGQYRNPFFFYTWDSALERVLILAGIAFLLFAQTSTRFIRRACDWVNRSSSVVYGYAGLHLALRHVVFHPTRRFIDAGYMDTITCHTDMGHCGCVGNVHPTNSRLRAMGGGRKLASYWGITHLLI
jgi:hypothetical protein